MNKQFLINPKQSPQTKKTETIEEFLQRGGKINKLPNIDRLYCIAPLYRVLLTEYMRKALKNVRLDFIKVHQFSCKILDQIDFSVITKKEIETIKAVMNVLEFELEVHEKSYDLKKKSREGEKEIPNVQEIVDDIAEMFRAGDSLIDIKESVYEDYDYDLDLLEIVSIIHHEMDY